MNGGPAPADADDEQRRAQLAGEIADFEFRSIGQYYSGISGQLMRAGRLPEVRKQGARGKGKNFDRVQSSIVRIAAEEFAEYGYSGARIDRIANGTRTSKRMLYYYFGGKEGLYRAVLLSYYDKLRSEEEALQLSHLPPILALKSLVDFTFVFHTKNAAIARLVMAENINKGRHVVKMPSVAQLNSRIINSVSDILRRGEEEGVIRPGLDGFDLYTTIAALCFFNISNRYTIQAIFKRDMSDSSEAARRRKSVWDTIHRIVLVESQPK
jgi:AcrR family transcriptional regulator